MKYRPEIDGLRALAVVPVVIYHAGFSSLGGGFLGVDVFFVISGYLITSIIAREIENGSFSVLNFYERRIRRILPILFFVMLTSAFVSWFTLLPSYMYDFSGSIISVTLFVSNWFFYKGGGYFAVASELKPLLHTWTLAVEEQYYVLFPIFIFSTWRLGIKWLMFLLLAIGIVSLLTAQWGSVAHPEAAYYLLPTRGWELLAGALVALGEVKKTARKSSQLLSLAGLSMVIGSIVFMETTTPTPSLWTSIPVGGTVLLLMFANPGTIVFKLLSTRLFVGFGLISYSVYLWHQPILVFARHVTKQDLDLGLAVALIIVTFVISYFSWRFIEQPFRKRHVIGRKLLLSLVGIFAVILLVFGFAGIKTSGFINRYSEEEQKILSSSVDPIDYMLGYFNSILLNDFDKSNPKTKVLIIGDSFAQDLTNAIRESTLSQRFQLSTYRISGRCGNLYLDEDFTQYIDKNDLNTCLSKGWYQNEKLQELLEQADEVWLASSWAPWNARLLPKSVQRIIDDFDVKVMVFGTKEFEEVDLRTFLRLPENEKRRHSTPVPERVQVINGIIQKTLQDARFIDISKLICPDSACPTLTPQGSLITFDGEHLTRSGAQLLGGLLEQTIEGN